MSVAVASPDAGPSYSGNPNGTPAAAVAASSARKHKKGKRSSSVADEGSDASDVGSTRSKGDAASRKKKQRRHREGRSSSPTASESSVTDDTSAYSDSDASMLSEVDGGQTGEGSGQGRLDKDARQKISGPAQSAFKYMRPIIDVPIPPALTHDPRRAAEELIDTLLMRYIPQLGGVLLSHGDITFLRRHARFDADGAFSIVPMAVTCLLWAPEVGMRLQGQLKLSTPSHVSLLVHGIFNASITASHLPSSLEAPHTGSRETAYDWHEHEVDMEQPVQEHAEIKEDPDEPMEGIEGASEAAATKDAHLSGADTGMDTDDLAEKSTGYWVNRKTGHRLGDDDKHSSKSGQVTFTVVGMTIANHMLSIHGSLLKRPYSIPAPTHVPTLVKTMPLEAAASETARRVRFNEENQTSEYHAYIGDDDDDDEENSEDESDHDGSNAHMLTGRAAQKATRIRASSESRHGAKKSKKRSKTSSIGPRGEGEGDLTTSGESGSESDASSSLSSRDRRREKKKRKKE